MALVQLSDVVKEYQIEQRALRVLRGVTMEVHQGEIVAITGSSGAGKSTLMHIIGGLDVATSGSVKVDGTALETMTSAQMADFRNKTVGFVFQFHHLLPEFTAEENVAMPLMIRGTRPRPAIDAARHYLTLVGLFERMHHKPAELSGGEQQRVAVARALVHEPKLVLADEPSGNLDSETGERLHALLWDLSRREGRTFVIVTHDPSLAHRADRILRMHDGVIVSTESEEHQPAI